MIVLIGDSHAMMWLPAVLEMAWRDGWVVVPLLRTGCMPNRWITDEGPSSCRVWYRWAMREVRLSASAHHARRREHRRTPVNGRARRGGRHNRHGD